MSTKGEIISSSSYPAGVSAAVFTPDGTGALVGADNGCIYLTGFSPSAPSTSIRGHDDIISSVVCWTGEFLSVGWDGMLNIWSTPDLRLSASASIPDCAIYGACLASDEAAAEVVTVGFDGFSRLWDMRALGSGCVQMINMNQIATACASALEPKTTFVGLADGDVAVIDWRFPSVVTSQHLHSGRVNSIRRVHSSQPNRFVTASDDCTALLFAASIFRAEETDDTHKCIITRYMFPDF